MPKKKSKVVEELEEEVKDIGRKVSRTAKKEVDELTVKEDTVISGNEKEVGIISHFFDKISVAVVELSSELRVGDRIHIKGNTTDFVQKVDSMQVEHDKISVAKRGQAIGMKTKDMARVHDKVFVIK